MSLIVKTALVWIQVEDVMVLEIAKSVEKTRSIVVRTFYFVFIWSYKGAHSNSRIWWELSMSTCGRTLVARFL